MQYKLTLEQLSGYPKRFEELPRDEVYVKLGCSICPHVICFKAKGVGTLSPCYSINPEASQALSDCIDDVDKRSDLRDGYSSTWDEPCEGPCPQIDDMELAVELLNDSFGSDLELP